MPYGCPWCGEMMGPGMFFWGLIWLFFLIFMIVGGIWIIQGAVRQRDLPKEGGSSDRAVEILRERYARGEINKEEFEERKRDLAA
ncbi:MAG TPA: SHOCT domain-containing protein [Candidatus Manganitrophaceae bacterium]|nr:SHOCT domain-containing protein [Candidatus Manganitrophaceae bacterium]